jgi:hypothetical protein
MNPMRLLWSVALAGLLFACTKPNPKSCADGICNDQAFPFCDVDGTLGGEPNECIAVDCTPGEVAECRGDIAVTCSSMGNNFDLVSCEGRCEVAQGGCVECLVDSECSNPEPICEGLTRQCRGCREDTECPSGVCNLQTGACVASADVVYAMPSGSGPAPCTMSAPCPLDRAISTALAAPTPPVVRMLQGVYTVGIGLNVNKSLTIVGSGATLNTNSQAVLVEGGGTLELRDLILQGQFPAGGVGCGFQTTPSTLILRKVTSQPEPGASNIAVGKCTLKVIQSELRGAENTLPIVRVESDGVLESDRSRFVTSLTGNLVQFIGQRMRGKMTNSIMDGVGFQFGASDPGGGSSQSQFDLGFNTFINVDVSCINPNNYRFAIVFENNIFQWSSAAPVLDGPVCTFNHNIFSPSTNRGGTNRDADPKFVDSAQKNYQLQVSSPAVDTGNASALLPASPDFAGVTRPQGAKPDIGAYERKP